MFLLNLLLAVVALQVAAPAVFTSADPMRDLLTYGAAVGTTLALGLAKKYTGVADTWIGGKIKPVQPLVVLAASVLLPALIHGTPNTPDPAALAVAPTATLLSVAAAEILRRFASRGVGGGIAGAKVTARVGVRL